jgi:hypothetical protein
MFRRGLKENVKDELMRNGGIIDSLDILIRTAIDIDDKLYEQAMEKNTTRLGNLYRGEVFVRS